MQASDVWQKVKATMASEEVQSAPGRFVGAVQQFLASDEVKSASASAVKAVPATLASDEVQELKNRGPWTQGSGRDHFKDKGVNMQTDETILH